MQVGHGVERHRCIRILSSLSSTTCSSSYCSSFSSSSPSSEAMLPLKLLSRERMPLPLCRCQSGICVAMEICVERSSERTCLFYVANFRDDTQGLQFYSDSDDSTNLFVNVVKKNSKAATLGLRAGDRIVSINGKIPEKSWRTLWLAQCTALPRRERDVSRAAK